MILCSRLCAMILLFSLNSASALDPSNDSLLEQQIVRFATEAQSTRQGEYFGWMSGSCVTAQYPQQAQGKIFIATREQQQNNCGSSYNFIFGGERLKPADHYNNPDSRIVTEFREFLATDTYKELVSYIDQDGNVAVNVEGHNRKLTLKKLGSHLMLRGQLINGEGDYGPDSVDFICEFSLDITDRIQEQSTTRYPFGATDPL